MVIRRPVRTVFPFLADAENARGFRSDIVTVRRTSGTPAGAGARYHQVVKLAWRRVEILLENTEYESERKLTFTVHKPTGVTLTTTFNFQPIEREHTRVQVATEGDARSLSSGLARLLQKREVESLHDLKSVLESRP